MFLTIRLTQAVSNTLEVQYYAKSCLCGVALHK
jgi:hypothetical protein